MSRWLLFLFFFYAHHCFSQQEQAYQLNKKLDYSILTASAAMFIADLTLSKNLDPLTEDQIINLRVDDILSLDRSATNNYSLSAKDLSDVFEFGVLLLPAPLMLSDDVRKETKEVCVMYVETFTLNLLTTQLVKLTTQRVRPFVYNSDLDISLKKGKNARRSFYSGHTSHTAALSIFTAKVFSDFHPESKWKPVVWTTAASIPIVTGYLRYKAGQHFPTDVAVGALAGGLIGFFVPELHKVKSKMPKGVNVSGEVGGLSLTYTY